MELRHMKKEVPIWEKSNLTIEEAAAYFNIGENKLRKLAADESCPFVLWVGSKCSVTAKTRINTCDSQNSGIQLSSVPPLQRIRSTHYLRTRRRVAIF